MNSPLGKGLESLIPKVGDPEPQVSGVPLTEKEEVPSKAQKADVYDTNDVPRTYRDNFMPRRGDAVFWLDIGKIKPNPYQPRREFREEALKDLANSITVHGLLQPIVVTKHEIDTPTGLDVFYELIAGERRWRAATLAGLTQIPAIIRRGMPDGRIKLELAIIENVQREDLNPIERARAFKQLVDEFKLVQRDIAQKIGKSREMVTNTIRLLALPEEIQNAVQSGIITEGHARTVLMAGDNQEKQFQIYRTIVAENLTVRAAENKAREIIGRNIKRRHGTLGGPQDPEIRVWEQQLQERLGTKVVMQRMGQAGRIVVEFYSEEELQRLLQKLTETNNTVTEVV